MTGVRDLIERALWHQWARQLGEAQRLYQQVVRIEPNNAEVWQQLGLIYYHGNQPEAACQALSRAIRINGSQADYHHNLGMVLCTQSKLKDAEASHRRALQLDPRHFCAKACLWQILMGTGRAAEAAGLLENIQQASPTMPEDRTLRGTILLANGRFSEGWKEFNCRYELPLADEPRADPKAMWDGSPLAGRKLLIFSEQGLGDTIQMARYFPLLKAQGAKTVFAVQSALVPLLRESGYSELVPSNEPWPETDVQIGVFSLPRTFGTTLESMPNRMPYLLANAELVALWRQRLADVPGLRVGINWQGNPSNPGDRGRSMSLQQFAPLAKVPGVRLVSLQKGKGSEQLADLNDAFDVVDLGDSFDVEHGPFMDTAAVMTNLDLVVTCDTAAAHLAGALGVPVWLALSSLNDWRWMVERDDSPWYPSMRLFRQREFGNWSEVFGRMAAELGKLSPQRGR